MANKNKTVRTTALTLPEMIREDLKAANIEFIDLKTTPNFRYFLTAETAAKHELEGNPFNQVDWARAYVQEVINVLGERPESFKVGDPKVDVSQAGNYWRLTVLIKAVGYTAPKREKIVQLTLDLDEATEVVEPTKEEEEAVVVEPEVVEPEAVVEPTVERIIEPATPMPVEKAKRVRKPGIKKASKDTEDVTIAE